MDHNTAFVLYGSFDKSLNISSLWSSFHSFAVSWHGWTICLDSYMIPGQLLFGFLLDFIITIIDVFITTSFQLIDENEIQLKDKVKEGFASVYECVDVIFDVTQHFYPTHHYYSQLKIAKCSKRGLQKWIFCSPKNDLLLHFNQGEATISTAEANFVSPVSVGVCCAVGISCHRADSLCTVSMHS